MWCVGNGREDDTVIDTNRDDQITADCQGLNHTGVRLLSRKHLCHSCLHLPTQHDSVVGGTDETVRDGRVGSAFDWSRVPEHVRGLRSRDKVGAVVGRREASHSTAECQGDDCSRHPNAAQLQWQNKLTLKMKTRRKRRHQHFHLERDVLIWPRPRLKTRTILLAIFNSFNPELFEEKTQYIYWMKPY